MPVPTDLLEMLCCPRCRGDLVYLQQREVIRCPACRLNYPVQDGIPVMLVDEARPDDDA